MTNPIAVSQQRRRILARQICAWAQSTRLSAKDAEGFAAAAIDAFEAEIRADEREMAAKVADEKRDHLNSMETDAEMNAHMDRKYPERAAERRKSARLLRIRLNLFGADEGGGGVLMNRLTPLGLTLRAYLETSNA